FLAAHLVGLVIINNYLVKDLPYNIQRPELEERTSFIPIFITILFATILALILIRFRALLLWKLWFFISIAFTLAVSFSTFFNQFYALILAILLALAKLFRINIIINNVIEMFIYGGLAAIFVPLFNLFSIGIFLLLISAYDAYAVFKSKHMIKLAKFQTKAKLFTGLHVPYKAKGEKKYTAAILGGGDIGFTLFFAGVILKEFNILAAIITSLIITLSLVVLFFIGKKGKFYPAMPVLSLGCLIAYLIIKFILF
ncbi:MAG: hypothetical protein AABX55_01790, partial [Nanoarchaeota archaeon]